MSKRYQTIDRIIAAEVYLYIIFMFLTKGEAIRNILLFSAFFLWLATLKYRTNKWILKKPVSLLLWGFMATVLLSAVFSIEPAYSLKSLLLDPLKSVLLFCLIATVFSDAARLNRFAVLAVFILIFTLAVGYYSYWAYDLPLMKPVTFLRRAWHSRFAMDINTLLPFALITFLSIRDTRLKLALIVIMAAGVLGIILSTARGGLAGFIVIALVWTIYFLRTRKVNLKIVAAAAILIVVLFSASLFLSPLMKDKFIHNKSNIMSLNKRTDIWGPLIAAASNRPVSGWGYGSKIFSMNAPFEDTPYKVAPVKKDDAFRNPHNAFLLVLFHQGMIGVISYITLLITATYVFWRGLHSQVIIKSHILAACVSIMAGTYFINSLSENPHLTDLALVLGTGLAAHYMEDEDSHN